MAGASRWRALSASGAPGAALRACPTGAPPRLARPGGGGGGSQGKGCGATNFAAAASHRSRHCFPVRPVLSRWAISCHLPLEPYSSTHSQSLVSSCARRGSEALFGQALGDGLRARAGKLHTPRARGEPPKSQQRTFAVHFSREGAEPGVGIPVGTPARRGALNARFFLAAESWALQRFR